MEVKLIPETLGKACNKNRSSWQLKTKPDHRQKWIPEIKTKQAFPAPELYALIESGLRGIAIGCKKCDAPGKSLTGGWENLSQGVGSLN